MGIKILKFISKSILTFQSNNRDKEYLSEACKKLRAKSESGYMGLVRLLHKYGYLNVLLEINHSTDSQEQPKQQKNSKQKNVRSISTSSAPAEFPSTEPVQSDSSRSQQPEKSRSSSDSRVCMKLMWF